MGLERSIKLLDQLANGIDPTTGEVLPDSSPYNNLEVIRAIFAVTGYIKALPKEGVQNSVSAK